MRYRVLYPLGESFDTRTRIETGTLVVSADGLRIDGSKPPLEMPFADVGDVELFRLNGVGTMLRVSLPDTVLFVTVVWFCLGQAFAMVNSRSARQLYRVLKQQIPGARPVV